MKDSFQPARPFLFFVFMVLLLSCASHKEHSNAEPITHEFLSKLESGKKYTFELKSGQTQKVGVTKIEDETISGYVLYEGTDGKTIRTSYSSSFESIERNVARITERKTDPLKVAIPLSAVVILLVFISGT